MEWCFWNVDVLELIFSSGFGNLKGICEAFRASRLFLIIKFVFENSNNITLVFLKFILFLIENMLCSFIFFERKKYIKYIFLFILFLE